MNRGSDAPAADLDCNSFDLIGGAKEVTTGVVATNKKAERAGVVNLIVMCIDGYFLLKSGCSFLDSLWKVRLNSSVLIWEPSLRKAPGICRIFVVWVSDG